MFNQSAVEALGFYVYGLFDPDEPAVPFYIGKGSGNRVFHHVQGAPVRRSPDDLMSLKHDRINQIGAGRVVHKVLRFGLSEPEALKVEATLIDLVNHIQPGQLTNEVSGHGVAESIYTTSDLEVALNAVELETEEPILLIKIERKWSELVAGRRDPSTLTRKELYDAVKGDWVLSVRRAQSASCVLAVARGLVRGVFVPESWEEAGYENRKRMTADRGDGGFDAFVGRSVAHLTAMGSQNPIRYVNS
jgi:uncharacterized protein